MSDYSILHSGKVTFYCELSLLGLFISIREWEIISITLDFF